MQRTRTTPLVLMAFLLLAGALVWSGCGDTGTTTTTGAAGALSGLEPFVANAYVTWTQNPIQTTVGDINQYRNGKLKSTIVASDPRVGGICEVTLNLDQRPDESADIWASWVLTNDKGTWVCDKQVGSTNTGYVDGSLFSQAKGTGEYEGLVSYWSQHFLGPDLLYALESPSAKSAIVGWIQKAK